MDAETLNIFKAVAAEGSVTHAAARLGRVPSNVTTRIQQLEADLAVPLFVRTGKRLQLSRAGEQFLDYAHRMLTLEGEARQVVGGHEGGVLRVGSMESTAASRLPGPLAAYHRQHPSTRLYLSTGQSRQLLNDVHLGRLDCAFVAFLDAQDRDHTLTELSLDAKPIWRETLMLLTPGSEQGTRDVSDIRTRNLATFPRGCTYRGMAERLLDIRSTSDWTIHEMPSYHVMIACVAAGSCVTVLPASVLALAAVPEALGRVDVGTVDTVLVWRRGYEVEILSDLLQVLAEGS